jgi:hypothetical protein
MGIRWERRLIGPRQLAAPLDRRTLLTGAATAIVAILGVAGCRKKLGVSCEGIAALSPADVQLRSTLGYVDTTPQPDRPCTACTLYVPPQAEGVCGLCKVVRGPIHPNGTCRVFLRKPV